MAAVRGRGAARDRARDERGRLDLDRRARRDHRGRATTRATDQITFTAAAGDAYTGVAFGDVPPNLFAAAGAQGVAAGAAALYAHTFTARSAGTVTLRRRPGAVARAAGLGDRRWCATRTATAWSTPARPLSRRLALTAGQIVCLVARHASPAGAPAGASEQATLSASFAYTSAAPALSATATLDDLTTVLDAGGGLVLSKSVDLATARPGDTLIYTITYTNAASTPLSSIVIRDATPAFTVFTSASCGTLGTGLSACGVTSAARGQRHRDRGLDAHRLARARGERQRDLSREGAIAGLRFADRGSSIVRMLDDRKRSGPDLRVARRYLDGYVEPDDAREAEPNWLPLYAWPAAVLLLLLAIVSWTARPDTMPSGLPDAIAVSQGYHDFMQYLMLRSLLLGLFSAGLIALNLAALMLDRARPFGMRLVDACSIVIPLLVLLSLVFFPVPLGVQFNP